MIQQSNRKVIFGLATMHSFHITVQVTIIITQYFFKEFKNVNNPQIEFIAKIYCNCCYQGSIKIKDNLQTKHIKTEKYYEILCFGKLHSITFLHEIHLTMQYCIC